VTSKILAFDTCGPVIGVALRVGEVTTLRCERVARGSETRLIPWVTALCAEAGIEPSALDGVAATVGPGAFTGIRVGLATATGLAMAIERPFWGIDSLTPRAARVGGTVLALLDARKGRVYAARFDGSRVVVAPADVDPDTAIGWMTGGSFVATGEGALVYADRIVAAGGTVAADAEDPAVDVLAGMAAAAFVRGEGVDPVSVAPVYLREADAIKSSSG
jgi:tRNA threonylcarbamoyladenosine biosynthesis protein TsaB